MAESPTVTVACKLPNGLVLRNFTMADRSEPVMGGGVQTVKYAVQDEGEVVLKGFAKAPGVDAAHPVVGGYGLTHGVDAGFFAKWMKDNATSDIVKNGLIFASERPTAAVSKATEMAGTRSGLEPIDTTKMPRGIEKAGVLESATG